MSGRTEAFDGVIDYLGVDVVLRRPGEGQGDYDPALSRRTGGVDRQITVRGVYGRTRKDDPARVLLDHDGVTMRISGSYNGVPLEFTPDTQDLIIDGVTTWRVVETARQGGPVNTEFYVVGLKGNT